MKKILFLIKERVHDAQHGITSGLYNSANFVVDFLNSNSVPTKLVSVKDGNDVDREVTNFNPDIVVLEALWVTPHKLQELINIPRHKNRRWVIRIHSKAPFLANEGVATSWIKDYCRINSDRIFIAPNTQELVEQLGSVFGREKFIFLPNLYKMKKHNVNKKQIENEINIGCFGAIRPMKNHYLQAITAIDFANQCNLKLNFHINGTRVEQKGENVLKNLRLLFEDSKHSLIEHPWMTHDEFLKVISTMDLGLQASLSESFNIVSADFVQMNVPIVVSNDIDWMPTILKVSPTNWKSIQNKMKLCIKFKTVISKLQRYHLNLYQIKSEWKWINNFLKL